jgi:hypothetical protein
MTIFLVAAFFGSYYFFPFPEVIITTYFSLQEAPRDRLIFFVINSVFKPIVDFMHWCLFLTIESHFSGVYIIALFPPKLSQEWPHELL